jgi:pyridoxal phosphate enzyme (YggS family)
MTSPVKEILQRHLAAVEGRLQSACRRAGRARQEVRLVAVTKTVSLEVAALLPELGVSHLGESRPQELWRKAAALAPSIHWHLVGHLQRNKIEPTLRLHPLIHSVDSLSLLAALEKASAGRPEPLDVLLEINASREPNKHGFAPEEVPSLVSQLARLQHVRIAGLMTMAALEEDPERCRPTFATVRTLCERLRRELGPAHAFDQLSMGMSNDFEVAIEEGTTLVRIGTALFDGLPRSPETGR